LRLFSLILARDEAGPDRYLRRVLDRCRSFSDAVLLLDDSSTDHTAEVARKYGAITQRRKSTTAAWGNEAPARAELWQMVTEYATEPGDWCLVADADMILHGDPRPLMLSRECNAWAWPLLDMWSETEYRTGGHWVGHLHPRMWMVRVRSQPPDFTPQWPARGLHCGHFPANFNALCGVAPPDVYWLHYSYATAEQRKAKYEAYLRNSHLLSPGEIAHARSILDCDTDTDTEILSESPARR
jgi:hypothetical protein